MSNIKQEIDITFAVDPKGAITIQSNKIVGVEPPIDQLWPKEGEEYHFPNRNAYMSHVEEQVRLALLDVIGNAVTDGAPTSFAPEDAAVWQLQLKITKIPVLFNPQQPLEGGGALNLN